MKKILFTLIAVSACTYLYAQDDNTIPEPEFMNQVYVLKVDKQLQPLEKVQAELKTKNKVIAMGNVKQFFIINGSKSSVVLPASSAMFVVSTGGNGFAQDPSTQFQLLKFETKKSNREALLTGYSGQQKKSDEPSNEISLNLKKIKEGVFGLVPGQTLEKGEYAFINKTSMQPSGMNIRMDAYAFSIE